MRSKHLPTHWTAWTTKGMNGEIDNHHWSTSLPGLSIGQHFLFSYDRVNRLRSFPIPQWIRERWLPHFTEVIEMKRMESNEYKQTKGLYFFSVVLIMPCLEHRCVRDRFCWSYPSSCLMTYTELCEDRLWSVTSLSYVCVEIAFQPRQQYSKQLWDINTYVNQRNKTYIGQQVIWMSNDP